MTGTYTDFASLKKTLLARNALFVDTEFPANNDSLTFGGHTPRGLPVRRVEWKRPYVSYF